MLKNVQSALLAIFTLTSKCSITEREKRERGTPESDFQKKKDTTIYVLCTTYRLYMPSMFYVLHTPNSKTGLHSYENHLKGQKEKSLQGGNPRTNR
jgi:hypothetical protein